MKLAKIQPFFMYKRGSFIWLIGYWKLEGRGLCYVVAGSLAILSLAVMWKIKNIPNELGDLSGNIYRQNAYNIYGKCKRRNIY